MPALIGCSCETLDQSCAKRAVWESAHWGLPPFAWGLHWSSDAQLWSLPELRCSYACAWPRALLIWTLTHRLNFLFWSQTYLALWTCLVTTDLPGDHWSTGWSWLLSPALLCFFEERLCWWGQCLCVPCCHPWLTSFWGEAHSCCSPTDTSPGVSETLSKKTILQSIEILIFQQKSMLTLYLVSQSLF